MQAFTKIHLNLVSQLPFSEPDIRPESAGCLQGAPVAARNRFSRRVDGKKVCVYNILNEGDLAGMEVRMH